MSKKLNDVIPPPPVLDQEPPSAAAPRRDAKPAPDPKIEKLRAAKLARRAERQALKASPLGIKAEAEVVCPECGTVMHAARAVEYTMPDKVTCALDGTEMQLVEERDGGRERVYRCLQKRHRIRRTVAERRALYDAAVQGLDKVKDAAAINAAQVRFLEDPAKDAYGRVLTEEEVTRTVVASRIQRFYCPVPGCERSRKMGLQRKGGKDVEVEVSQPFKFYMDSIPAWAFPTRRRCDPAAGGCNSTRTKLRSVKEECAWVDCLECGRSWKVLGTQV